MASVCSSRRSLRLRPFSIWLLAALGTCAARAESEAPSLLPIVVTATRTERAMDEAPVRTEVVTRAEIDRTHARTLTEALENVPGLQLSEVHGKSGYEVSLQGLTSDQVLVLIDGLPITASTGSTVDLSQYLLADVERIEIVKGAASAQYGSSAMGGVINVITRRTAAGVGGTAVFDVGSYGRQNDSGKALRANDRHAGFRVGGGSEHWRLAVTGDRVDSDGFDTDPAAWARQGDASRRQQLGVRGDWLAGPQGGAWIDLSRYTENDQQRFDRFVPPNVLPQRKDEAITRDRVAGGGSWRWGRGWRAGVKALDERYRSHSPAYSLDTLTDDRRARQQRQQLSTQLELPAVARQLWMIGTDWRHDTLAQTVNGKSELDVPGRAQHTSREVFVQDNVLLGERWELLLGLRGQSDSGFGSHWAPKLSVRGTVYEQGDWKGVLRASVGQGYRVPNLTERYYLFDHSSLGYVVLGNPQLRPETSTSLQLGGSLSRGDRLQLDLNLFSNRLRDLIQIDTARTTVVNGLSTYTYANVARARTAGVEASARWHASSTLDLTGAYTYTQSRDLSTGSDLTRRPRHIVRLGADWRMWPDTTLTLRTRHQSSELADSATGARSPGWSTLDVALNQRIGRHTTLFFGINNLTGRQRDFANANDFGPIAGRYYYLGARFALGNAAP